MIELDGHMLLILLRIKQTDWKGNGKTQWQPMQETTKKQSQIMQR